MTSANGFVHSFVNTLRPRWNGRHFADDIFKCIFLNENVWFPIEIPLKFVPMGLINTIPALVQIMAWRRPGDKPLSEPMMVSLLTHICVTRPQWVHCKDYLNFHVTHGAPFYYHGSWLILDLSPANERRRYFVTTSLIGWAQIKNRPCQV